MAALVDFYFGPGSRYSYLAATQLEALAARAHARFRWRALFSPDLFAAAGYAPFAETAPSGQYAKAYRNEDARRWAALYGVPLIDPDLDHAAWRRFALALSAAGAGAERLARALYAACFARGAPPRDDAGLAALIAGAGLSEAAIMAALATGEAEQRHSETLAHALAAGAFGVPSFVTEDGALFFGNDRLALLEAHLNARGG